MLAGRFRLTAAQIRQAALRARNQARWRGAARSSPAAAVQPTLVELFAAARDQSGRDLENLSRKIKPKQTWRDLVLPPDQEMQLHEICDQAKFRQRVYGDWGFDRKLSFGKGLNALFAGPPGTGKTMAAEVIAGELGSTSIRSICRGWSANISARPRRISTASSPPRRAPMRSCSSMRPTRCSASARRCKDAHDRYANIEIGYLLQKMEEYEGIAILATNLRQNLDDAFLRRLHSIVEFPFPGRGASTAHLGGHLPARGAACPRRGLRRPRSGGQAFRRQYQEHRVDRGLLCRRRGTRDLLRAHYARGGSRVSETQPHVGREKNDVHTLRPGERAGVWLTGWSIMIAAKIIFYPDEL